MSMLLLALAAAWCVPAWAALPDLPAPQASDKRELERAFASFLREAARSEQARRDARGNPLMAAASGARAGASRPSLTVPLGDSRLSLARDAFALSTPDSRFRIGGGAMDDAPIGRVEYSRLITDRFALGASMQVGQYQRELIGPRSRERKTAGFGPPFFCVFNPDSRNAVTSSLRR